MADSAVSRGNGDVFELDVHIVFGCREKNSSAIVPARRSIAWVFRRKWLAKVWQGTAEALGGEVGRTFYEFPSVDLA